MVKLVKNKVLTYNYILGYHACSIFGKMDEVANGAVCKYHC